MTAVAESNAHAGCVRLLRAALVLYVLTLCALAAAGVEAAVPWPFLGLTLAVVLPFSYAITRGLLLVGRLLEGRQRLVPPVGILLGVVLVWCYRLGSPGFLLTCSLLLAILAVDCWRDRDGLLRPLATAMALVFVGFGTVNNLSYLAARLTAGRVHDADLRALDLAIYRVIIGPAASYEGIFPLTDSRFWFRLLENAYAMLVAEIFIVILVFLLMRRGMVTFYRLLFSCYLIGLAVFAVYPTVAPDVYYPASLRPAYRDTLTAALGQRLSAEYLALNGDLPLSGFGYFIGFPSLHVTVSVLLQAFLTLSPIHFWTLLPINVLLVLSTVVLGHHYLVDVPAGLLLAASVLAFRRYLGARHAAAPRFPWPRLGTPVNAP